MAEQERNYYVLCDDKCLIPAMSKEQVLAAIAAATGNTTEAIDVNDAFITKIQEQNKLGNLKFWVGTQAEYNAITDPENEVFYILTDVDDYSGLAETIQGLINGGVKAKEAEHAYTTDNARVSTVTSVLEAGLYAIVLNRNASNDRTVTVFPVEDIEKVCRFMFEYGYYLKYDGAGNFSVSNDVAFTITSICKICGFK